MQRRFSYSLRFQQRRKAIRCAEDFKTWLMVKIRLTGRSENLKRILKENPYLRRFWWLGHFDHY
jgi:hypothetical protein